jgi:hypothetical protein
LKTGFEGEFCWGLIDRGKIDQVGRVLALAGGRSGGGGEGELSEFYGAVGKWAGNSRGLFRSFAKV